MAPIDFLLIVWVIVWATLLYMLRRFENKMNALQMFTPLEQVLYYRFVYAEKYFVIPFLVLLHISMFSHYGATGMMHTTAGLLVSCVLSGLWALYRHRIMWGQTPATADPGVNDRYMKYITAVNFTRTLSISACVSIATTAGLVYASARQ